MNDELVGVLLDMRISLQSIERSLQEINDKLAHSTESRSSVELATSTRGVDVKVKCYAGSDVMEAEGEAVRSYMRIRSEIEERLMNGGKPT